VIENQKGGRATAKKNERSAVSLNNPDRYPSSQVVWTERNGNLKIVLYSNRQFQTAPIPRLILTLTLRPAQSVVGSISR
jgi:hypothetical protein